MADYTQPVTNSPPNIFIKTMQMGLPGIQLPQIFGIYKSAAQKDPEYVAKTDPADLADEAIAAAKAAQKAAPAPSTATTTPGSGANLGTIDVTAQRLQADRLNTDLVSPYRGTTQELANPENPAASGQSQFDPAAMQSAQQKYADYVNNSQLARGAGQFFAAMGGANAAQAQGPWDAQDKLQHAITIGAQKAMQEQATAGTENATKLQTMAKEKGVYQGTQQEQQQKLDLGTINVQMAQQANKPGTPQTLMAKMMLAQQFKDAGMTVPPEVTKILQDPNTTGTQLAAFMSPNVLEAYKSKIGTQNVASETAQRNLGTKIMDTATEGGTKVPQGMNLSLNIGGANIAPNQQVTTEQAAVGARAGQTENQISNFKTLVEPSIDTTMKNLQNTYTGKGASAYARFAPGDNNQVAIAQQFARINQVYPEALPPEVAASIKSQSSQPGWNGQLKIELSPAQAFQALASAKANVARIEADRQARLQFQNSGKNPIEYSASPEAQAASSKKAVINPKTFKVTLIDPNNPEDLKTVQEQGLESADNFKLGK